MRRFSLRTTTLERSWERVRIVDVPLRSRHHRLPWRLDVAYRYVSGGDIVVRDFFLGFIKIHVLHHAAAEPVYGAEMIEELSHHGYDLSPGTLYPLLHALERDGLLSVEKRVVKGRQRKYYTATAEGERALAEAKAKIRELVDEVLEGDSEGGGEP